MAERLLRKQKVAGSTPVLGSGGFRLVLLMKRAQKKLY